MVYIKSKDQKNINLNIDLGLMTERKKHDLVNFLEEQVEIWVNKERIQKDLNHLEDEESEVLDFEKEVCLS